MPFAVDDADGDLSLAFSERVMAGMEMRAERRGRLRQLGIVNPDLAQPADLGRGPLHWSDTLLLLLCHLLIGNLGITAKGRRIGHFGS
jgi:hypothetical protein